MRIWTKTERWKGYIPSDKVDVRGIPFESCSISNFGINYKDTQSILIEDIKAKIVLSDFYKEIVKDGYHTHLYLNKNFDGVDCFISR